MNTKKQRLKFYQESFFKYFSVEQIIEMGVGISQTLTKRLKAFQATANGVAWKHTAETIGDIEVEIELLEDMFPNLRSEIEATKKKKLRRYKEKLALEKEERRKKKEEERKRG